MTDYTKLIEALRLHKAGAPLKCADCSYKILDFCIDRMCQDAANAIEELSNASNALNALKSRWIKPERKEGLSYGPGYAECSECHAVTFLGWNMKYCPQCGAKMGVQDGEKV